MIDVMKRRCWLLVIAWMAAGSAWSADFRGDLFMDGFESGDTARWTTVVGGGPPDSLRFSDLDLRDPHLFVDVPVLGCLDLTDDGVAGLVPSFNEQVEESITTDGDGDGLLDLSLLLLFRPFNPAIEDGSLAFAGADCSAPLGTTTCTPATGSGSTFLSYESLLPGPCLEAVAGTTSGYSPAVDEPAPPCFASHPADFELDFGGIPVRLAEARLAATWMGEPPFRFEHGLLMGFLSEADADAILIPPEVPLVGGQPLSVMLPGGTGNCAPGDDRDTLNSVIGWWFYLNYVADSVPYDESLN
jgi:hypothetical protein